MPGPGGGQPQGSSGGNGNKDNDDEKKRMLAKAALWMLTAYMFIAIISLLFPGSNQPEVSYHATCKGQGWNLMRLHFFYNKGCNKKKSLLEAATIKKKDQEVRGKVNFG